MRATLYSKTETRHFKNCYDYSISKISSDTRLRQVLSLTNCEVQNLGDSSQGYKLLQTWGIYISVN